MIHAREDYNRIQDPAADDPTLLREGSTAIGENEPVFLLRAQDENFREMLEHYAYLLERNAIRRKQQPPEKMIRITWAHADYAEVWQNAHGCKIPDIPEEGV